MTLLFRVNTEGGPLLLTSLEAARQWRGADEDETGSCDYTRLCERFGARPSLEGVVCPIGGALGLGWEMMGGGTAAVFVDATGKITIVRPWMEEDADADGVIARLREAVSLRQEPLGRLAVNHRELAILWAAESGAVLPEAFSGLFFEVTRGTAVGGSVYALRTMADAFDCHHDEVSVPGGEARRLTLVPVKAG